MLCKKISIILQIHWKSGYGNLTCEKKLLNIDFISFIYCKNDHSILSLLEASNCDNISWINWHLCDSLKIKFFVRISHTISQLYILDLY